MHIDNRISGKTKIICLIGNPVEHSISPILHNTISRFMDIDLAYVTFKVEKNDLETAVKGLKALNIQGFNITVPYKKEIIKYLDENSKNALLMGAVNTVKYMDGRFYGYNTDADGFLRSFREETGESLMGRKIAIIGAGGAARAIAAKAAMEDAKEICIINRTLSKAQEIAEVVNNNIKKTVSCFCTEDANSLDVLDESEIIINATSIGMYPETEFSPVGSFKGFKKEQIVYDVIYNPGKTKFLADAEKAGCTIINGLGMLFYQAVYAYEIWTGIKLPEDILKNMYISIKEQINI
ncbi:MAG: shikimate dehydrogenase [Bacillota bacterium]|nr:shikimate dehydrogenase [Bacillota bacterium]